MNHVRDNGGPPEATLRETVLDAAAAHCARSGDPSAFESIIRSYNARVYQFLVRRGVRASDAEDLTQETFLRAWRAIGTFDPGGRAKFSTWIFTIAARLASSHARNAAVAARAMDGVARIKSAQTPRVGAGVGNISGADSGVDLWALADQVLGAEQRTALWLRYAEDLTPEEIGLVMERTGVSVRVMLFRGRARLARELERLGAGACDISAVRGQEGCHA